MDLNTREFWALVHGILLGGAFLLAFTGGLADFYSLRPGLVTEAGVGERIRRLRIGTGAIAVLTWLTVIVGTWVVYPSYREATPSSPKSKLLANPDTKDWHDFAMEWKEHIAWIAPMLATGAARPNGPVAAALLATGIGSLVLAILVVIAEASESFANSLAYSDRVGPLAGKKIWAVVAFFASWLGFTVVLRTRQIDLGRIAIVAAILIALALIGTFAPFFQLFAPD